MISAQKKQKMTASAQIVRKQETDVRYKCSCDITTNHELSDNQPRRLYILTILNKYIFFSLTEKKRTKGMLHIIIVLNTVNVIFSGLHVFELPSVFNKQQK